ncbi:E3 ubiquitin-protein ligase TRIM47-like [Polyodon spathula]|uniref:E3 ubiquitin-protein ligase TRIM47-like n=1 Tax=Polyodon spathula TaxID=7913 RepID=UPI001B7F064D|nr:E3 ubiquitin-protein ligase TRIM47-like [Polyodon spathula]
MAAAAVSTGQVSEDQIICPICLAVFTDPASTPCGHSFCSKCVGQYWDQSDTIKCPLCKKRYYRKPDLSINRVLAEIAENFRKQKERCTVETEPGDVPCDLCIGRKFKAVKSCLTCLASYCETHIKPHREVVTLRKHRLVDATENLEEKLCQQHQRALEVFCRTDQSYICWLCTEERHRGHDTVSAEKERADKQKQLEELQTEIQKQIQKRAEKLKEALEAMNSSEQRDMEANQQIKAELIQSIETFWAEVTKEVDAKNQAAVNRVEGLKMKLQQEIAELRRRNAELKQLSETEDHTHFIQGIQSLSPDCRDLSSLTVNTETPATVANNALSRIKELIGEICEGELENIVKAVNEAEVCTLVPGNRGRHSEVT